MAKYFKLIAENRQARFDYNIIETYKAGLVLEGYEVKSIRLGKVNLKDSFGRAENEAIWMYGIHISPYQQAAAVNPTRPRKILLKKRELRKLLAQAAEKGLTIVPLKIFFDGNWAKLEIGLCKAKRKYEKRDQIRRRETQREIETAVRGKVRE